MNKSEPKVDLSDFVQIVSGDNMILTRVCFVDHCEKPAKKNLRICNYHLNLSQGEFDDNKLDFS